MWPNSLNGAQIAPVKLELAFGHWFSVSGIRPPKAGCLVGLNARRPDIRRGLDRLRSYL